MIDGERIYVGEDKVYVVVGSPMVVYAPYLQWVEIGGGGCSGSFHQSHSMNDSLWERWKYNFIGTNTAIPGLMLPSGIGLITTKYCAQFLETPTLGQYLLNSLKGIPAAEVEWTSIETLVLDSGTFVFNFIVVGGAFEVGIAIGSLIQVAVVEPLQPQP